MKIREAQEEDAEEIANIYNQAIRPDIYAVGTLNPITVEDREQWLRQLVPPFGAFIYEDDSGQTIGWASLNPFPVRPAFTNISEISVYVAEASRSRGIGFQLLAFLIEKARQSHFSSLMAIIYKKNEPSIAATLFGGFEICATFESLSVRYDTLEDVVWVQKDLAMGDPSALTATLKRIEHCL